MPKKRSAYTKKKLNHFIEQCECPRPCKDIIMASIRRTYLHWYINKTNQFETWQRHTNSYLSETDQLNTLQSRFNWYLDETNIFETSWRRIAWYLGRHLRYLVVLICISDFVFLTTYTAI